MTNRLSPVTTATAASANSPFMNTSSCLAFAQLTWRESLRDIETCLASFGPKLYHAGIRQAASLYADEPFRFELQAAA